MRKPLGILCVAGLLVGTASAQIGRLYFDLLGNAGNGGNEEDCRDGATAQENPVLPVGGGRLWVYWQFGHRGIDDGKGGYPEDHQEILGLGVDINIDGPGGVLGDAFYYNPQIFRCIRRWNVSSPRPRGGGGGTSLAFNAASVNTYGLLNDEFAVADDGQLDITDGPFGSTLLGYVDVVGDGGNNIWFSGNGFGIAEFGGDASDLVYFGFGDDAVNTLTGTSTVADATIIPEPAGLMLLGLGALALRRSPTAKTTAPGSRSRSALASRSAFDQNRSCQEERMSGTHLTIRAGGGRKRVTILLPITLGGRAGV